MAYFEGHSIYQTDCKYFNWKFVNYDPRITFETMYTGGNRRYVPECGLTEDTYSMFMRPIARPCEGCPFYDADVDKGVEPPGGYD